jgi:pimeloyl-ACP methyl ester carboxylesterase
MPWTPIKLRGHWCDVFEPVDRNAHGFVIVYLHGVHQTRLADQPAFTAEFERHGLPVVVPFTGRSWWTDRICPEFDATLTAERHVLDNVLPLIKARYAGEPPPAVSQVEPRIALLGTSMGGQGALRFAFKYPNRFPVVAAISPAIDYQLRWNEGDETLPQMYSDPEAVRQDTATLHVHPLNWPRNIWFCCDPADTRWHDSADRLHMKLAALGIPHECDLETSAGGRGFAYYNHMVPRAVAFLVERLERERLRVV